MIIIAIVISIFFIVVIAILCRSYTKDIFELENRVLQLEKRINGCINAVNELIKRSNFLEWCHIPDTDQLLRILNNYSKPSKEVSDMACKKGRGGRKK